MPVRMRDCEHCHYAFPAKSKKARFCSDAHRAAAGRARRNEEALLAEQQPAAPAPESAPVVADLDQLVTAVAARLSLALQLPPAPDLEDDDEEDGAAPRTAAVRGTTAGPVETATRRTLEAAARAETPLGLAALVLAQRLDNAHGETGSALRSLGTGLRELMTSAMDRAGAVPTPGAGGTPDGEDATAATDNVSPIEARRRQAEERRRQAQA